MGKIVQNVAIIGATGLLGTRIATALVSAGYTVTAVQRKESDKQVPSGVKSLKADLHSQSELAEAFKGQDAVISAVGFPALETEKIWIQAAIAASVKRIIPSEFSTNLDSPLSITLPIVTDKVKVRQYLTSKITSESTATTWTSLNNGPFLDVTINGALGPIPRAQKAIFHNGGNNEVGGSTLADIAKAIVQILDDNHFQATANEPVYIYSAAITERKITAMVSKILGIDFGSVEDGRIQDVNVTELRKECDKKLQNGDQSVLFNYYYVMMYEEGYGGREFRKLSWNERLGIPVMNDQELEEAVREFLG